MKGLLLPLVFFVGAIVAGAESKDAYRTFTDQQGRNIRAVIVRTGHEDVWIRRDDGQTFRVSRATFSETDRKFIEQWERETALKSPTAFEFTARRYTDGRQSMSTTSTRITTGRLGYIVSITNNTTFDLSDLEIEYRCYAMRGDLENTGQKRRMEEFSGQTRIASLRAKGTEEFKTVSMPLTSTQLKPDWTYTSTSRRRTDDALGGVWVRVRQNGKIIAEFSTPSRLKETETW